MPPLFVQALHTKKTAPDLGAWYPLIVGLALCSSVTERVPFWYLRRRLQTGPHSSFRVPLGGGLPGLKLEHFPVPEGLQACEPVLSPTWGLSPVVAGGSSQEPQPSVGHALQTIAAHKKVMSASAEADACPTAAKSTVRRVAGAAFGRLRAKPAMAGVEICSKASWRSDACSGPGGSVYGPTSQPVDWRAEQGFQCDRIACLRATKVLLTLAMCRNAWPHIFRGHRQWNVADARASHRYGDFARYAQHFACSMFQPSTSFLVGCAMVACLVSERGALLRGFSAGSYSCTCCHCVTC